MQESLEGSDLLPNQEAVVHESSLMLIEAQSLKIVSAVEFQKVVEFKKRNKAKIKWVEELCKPAKKAAHEAHKKAVELETKLMKPLKEADQLADKVLLEYTVEQSRLQEEARKIEEEKARLEREEAFKKAEEERMKTVSALIDQGNVDAGLKMLEQEIVVPQIVRPVIQTFSQAVPKISGYSTAPVFSAEVFDVMALIRAVAEGKAPISCVSVDMSFLNGQARALKQDLNYPGVRAISNLKSTTRAGKAAW